MNIPVPVSYIEYTLSEMKDFRFEFHIYGYEPNFISFKNAWCRFHVLNSIET